MSLTETNQPGAEGVVDAQEGLAYRYVEVNGTRIHYLFGGDGPLVVRSTHGHGYDRQIPLSSRGSRGLS